MRCGKVLTRWKRNFNYKVKGEKDGEGRASLGICIVAKVVGERATSEGEA